MTLEDELTILSLGAGVQSSALLLMSCKGCLPKIDHAVFADTGWEPVAVYEHLEWLKGEAESHGIPVHIINNGDLKEDLLNSQVRGGAKGGAGKRFASLPLFTKQKDGRVGMIRRQCTSEYKIHPITFYIKRGILGLKPRQRVPKHIFVNQWLGISTDEARRAVVTEEYWREFQYPLIMKKLSRADCVNWLAAHYPDRVIPRSACLGCPYHSDHEWRMIRDHAPNEWADVVATDKAIRDMGGMRGQVFLHRSCVPLDEVDFRTAEDYGQLTFLDECGGVCNV